MEGLTVFETEAVYELLTEIKAMRLQVQEMHAELKEAKKPYISAQELMELIGFGKKWVNDNKQHIGYSMVGGCLRFKRSDVIEFMDSNYYKTGKRKS